VLNAIDHLVIAVDDLPTATKSYERLGFTVVAGGRHPEGTYNALVAFADGSYLELLAFYEPNPMHRWWPALESGGGLVDFCAASTDLPADAAALRNAGVDIGETEPGNRARPDGYRVRWRLATSRGAHRGIVPFLIQDETPREERVPPDTRHANGVTGIDTVTVAVPDLGPASRWYASTLCRAIQPVTRDALDAHGLRIAIGRQTIELLAPRGAMGPLAEWLRGRGAGPYGASLTASAGAWRGELETDSTHGARLTLV